MNQRHIGTILIVLGIILVILLYVIKVRQEAAADLLAQQTDGSCFLEDGTCLHASATWTAVIGWILAAAVLILGFYLTFFDKTQQALAEQHIQVSSALAEAKKTDKKEAAFQAFLSAFTEDEQVVLKAIKEQEGITQSTLRYKTGLSKTGLSLLLKSLEERGIIARKESGKTNQVFLRKKY